ncbi:sulfatase family protein [Zobellia galactanivorans]|uniref:Sulfatase, family S1-15 n=1 Tax=Zobellia galactanivorans (strain DSM 12802 / CCUG 47099 / CIP 106680 / NCIMB 13871 / Dsij) TaxID=63186 RepID=G0L1B7_ZOBGA|nr:arylsulfatase [Zobellia galactanivorans]CAZ97756.1 Sulfatase, family S1-15 [Zobellia galactanivorans]
MNRFTLIRKICFLVFLAGLSSSLKAQDHPNIVIVMADDIGLGDIGFYHKERTGKDPLVPTPNIDELIANGMRFSDAHSPASLCAPTRYSMMTGNYPYRNTNSPWGVWSPLTNDGIGDNATTLSRIAKKAGYNTAFFGKWGLGGVWNGAPDDYSKTEGGAQRFGFDYSIELPQGIQNKPYIYYENGEWMKLQADSKLVHIPFEQTEYEEDNRKRNRDGIGDSHWNPSLAGPILANKAVDYIKNQKQKPFFIYYCSQAVHVPHTPAETLDGVKIKGSTLGNHGDMIAELDAQVGMMIKALKKTGTYKNTLFVFTSDNGGLNHDRALTQAGHDSSNGLAGKKASIYEGGHRVPFVAVWPGKIAKNSVSDVAIVGHDMVATLSEIVNLPLDDKVLDSANLLPIFTQNSDQPVHKYLMHMSQAANGPFYAIRDGHYKLILRGKNKKNFKDLKPIELYHLKDNIQEQKEMNLIDRPEQAKRVARMHKKYLELRNNDTSTLF